MAIPYLSNSHLESKDRLIRKIEFLMFTLNPTNTETSHTNI